MGIMQGIVILSHVSRRIILIVYGKDWIKSKEIRDRDVHYILDLREIEEGGGG